MDSLPNTQVNDKEIVQLDSDVEDFTTPIIFIENGRNVIKLMCLEPHPSKANKKLLPESYSRCDWLSLSPYQKKQAVNAWNSLSTSKKDCINVNISNQKNQRRGLSSISGGDDLVKINTSTNKHDVARMLHIFVDSQFASLWTSVHQVKDRVSLDDKEHDPD